MMSLVSTWIKTEEGGQVVRSMNGSVTVCTIKQ